jgi:hypothetical protein
MRCSNIYSYIMSRNFLSFKNCFKFQQNFALLMLFLAETVATKEKFSARLKRNIGVCRYLATLTVWWEVSARGFLPLDPDPDSESGSRSTTLLENREKTFEMVCIAKEWIFRFGSGTLCKSSRICILNSEKNGIRFQLKIIVSDRVVDPDPDWILIQRLCGSGSRSVLGIRIQGQENEEFSVEKCTF